MQGAIWEAKAADSNARPAVGRIGIGAVQQAIRVLGVPRPRARADMRL